MNSSLYYKNDPWLAPFEQEIIRREELIKHKRTELTGGNFLSDFANGHHYFGLHKGVDKWYFREWAPNATKIYLIGEMNGWKEKETFRLNPSAHGVWELKVPLNAMHHKQLYHLIVYWEGGSGERVPSYATRVVQDKQSLLFNAQVWEPPQAYVWKHSGFIRRNEPDFIYEAHVGMSSEEEKVATFHEFREKVLPRIIKNGYNTIQLMAIQEHPYYGSFGYHVSSFFAVSSRFGTPEDLKTLIDEAHANGIAVIMDLVHSHAVRNEVEGLGKFDGTRYQYFHDGAKGEHPAWDSFCFNYGKNEVLHFLLSNCKYWLEQFHLDGFRFDGVTSMLYFDHGLARNFTSYADYYNENIDTDALIYLSLANELIHEINSTSLSIAEEMSGMPGLAADQKEGGIGFDYRLAMGTPDFWIKLLKEVPDENWKMSRLFHELSNHRDDEKTVGYAESHDQALVGDKTIIFRLMDQEIYWSMTKDKQNLIIDRGIALHKMIRLVTAGTAGGGYLNFMGNEFGHPEWIDFPREGNGWSYKYARRQWSLVDNKALRYHYLADFDETMIKLLRKENVLTEPFPQLITAHDGDHILAFSRKNLLFVFNFHPDRSFTDYGIPVRPGKYRIVLNTDNNAFGGQDRIEEAMTYYPEVKGIQTTPWLKLYLPARTGLVFRRIPSPGIR